MTPPETAEQHPTADTRKKLMYEFQNTTTQNSIQDLLQKRGTRSNLGIAR
jgi:hypothetical protein